MSVSNFVRTTIKNSVSSGATTIDVDTASSPFNNPPSSGRGFMVDSLDSPTKWEEFTWTGRSAISGGFQLTGVTRNEDSNTGSAQSFDAGHYMVQSVSGTTKVATDEAQTFSALQTFSSGINLGDENLTDYATGTFNFTPDSGDYDITQTNNYVRIGDVVHIFFDVNITAINSAGSGSFDLTGLPFSAADNSSAGGKSQDGLNNSGSETTPHVPSGSSLNFRLWNVASGTRSGGNLQHSDVQTGRVRGFVTYRTTD